MCRKLIAGVVSTTVVMLMMAVLPQHLGAAPVSATYTYACQSPTGTPAPWQATVAISADVPTDVAPGQTFTVSDYTVRITAPAINFSFDYVGFSYALVSGPSGAVSPAGTTTLRQGGATVTFSAGFTFTPQSVDFVATGSPGDTITFTPGQIRWSIGTGIDVVCGPLRALPPFASTIIRQLTPTTKADCKNGGWRNLANAQGQPFRNQGQCVSYVMARRG